MNRILKKILYGVGILIGAILLIGLVLAYFPTQSIVKNKGTSPEEAAVLRSEFKGPHHLVTTSDGETLFLRRWNPEIIDSTKKEIAVLLFHGFTAHSGAGAYNTACTIIAKGGFTTFGLDYRGHGLSSGNRGDSPGKESWLADLEETIAYVKSLGFPKVIILGHSLGVASAIYVTMAIPDEISGLILLSGAYKGREGVSRPIPFFEQARIIASSVFRPSKQVIEYYRDGMTGTDDPLFNFKYTLRFATLMDVKKLILPAQLNIPVLVAVGDKDELFEVEKVKELYDGVPGDKKEFMVLTDTYHAKFPDASWEQLVGWLDRNF